MPERYGKPVYHLLLSGAFIALLFVPGVVMLFSEKEVFSLSEKRMLAPVPNLPDSPGGLNRFFPALDAYLNDHFGLREQLIAQYQREVRKRFGIAPAQSTVHQGLDHWLYYDGPSMLLDFAGKADLSTEAMDAWVKRYHEKKQRLDALGIHYLLVVSPNKQSVYPEYMMAAWQEVQGSSRLQRLVAAHPEIADHELLTLAGTLQRRKPDQPLFFKSDSHWTPFGAYLAFAAIADRLESLFPGQLVKKEFPFSGLQQRTCAKQTGDCGDLSKMLLDYEPFTESFQEPEPFVPCATRTSLPYRLSNLKNQTQLPSFVTICPQAKVRAVVFRDSFLSAVEPYLSENFKEAVYLWKDYDEQNIEELLTVFRPDIVIEEIAERNLFNTIVH